MQQVRKLKAKQTLLQWMIFKCAMYACVDQVETLMNSNMNITTIDLYIYNKLEALLGTVDVCGIEIRKE